MNILEMGGTVSRFEVGRAAGPKGRHGPPGSSYRVAWAGLFSTAIRAASVLLTLSGEGLG